ncbi:hypothetical protein ABT234_33630 [Streptomyces sp. NPDC001586]|uniref:hypothetical protein n=1 Tax=Streptomyces sp. NPDC001586 TaxID=3154387 RepID=UPI0033349A62
MHSRVTATPDSPNALAALPDALSRTAELKGAVWSAGKTSSTGPARPGWSCADLAPADLVPLMCGIAYAVHVHGGSRRSGPTRRTAT